MVRALILPIIVFVVAIIAAIVLFYVAKKDAAINQKRLLLTILLGAIILLLPVCLVFTNWPYMPHIYIVVVSYSLLMGIIYVRYFPRVVVQDGTAKMGIQLLTLFIMSLITASLFMVVFYFFSQIDYGIMAPAPLCYVFLPLLFNFALSALLNIPIEIYQVWYYDDDWHYTWFDDHFDTMFVFEVELYKNRYDSTLTRIKAKAPRNIIFKDWFQRFLVDFNKKYPRTPIECISYGGREFGWVFYVKPQFWPVKRYIDFEKTIYSNQISDMSIIVAKRVIQEKEGEAEPILIHDMREDTMESASGQVSAPPTPAPSEPVSPGQPTAPPVSASADTITESSSPSFLQQEGENVSKGALNQVTSKGRNWVTGSINNLLK